MHRLQIIAKTLLLALALGSTLAAQPEPIPATTILTAFTTRAATPTVPAATVPAAAAAPVATVVTAAPTTTSTAATSEPSSELVADIDTTDLCILRLDGSAYKVNQVWLEEPCNQTCRCVFRSEPIDHAIDARSLPTINMRNGSLPTEIRCSLPRWDCPELDYSLQGFDVKPINATTAEISLLLPIFAIGRRGKIELNYTGEPVVLSPLNGPEYSLEQPVLPPSDAQWIRKPTIRTADGTFTSPSIKYYLSNLKPAHNYWFKLAVYFNNDEHPFNKPLESTILRSRTPPLELNPTRNPVEELNGIGGVSAQAASKPASTIAPQPTTQLSSQSPPSTSLTSSPTSPSAASTSSAPTTPSLSTTTTTVSATVPATVTVPATSTSTSRATIVPATATITTLPATATSSDSSSTETHRGQPSPSSESSFRVSEAPTTRATAPAEIVTQPKQQQPTISSTITSTSATSAAPATNAVPSTVTTTTTTESRKPQPAFVASPRTGEAPKLIPNQPQQQPQTTTTTTTTTAAATTIPNIVELDYALQGFDVKSMNATTAEITLLLPIFAIGRRGKIELNYTGEPASSMEHEYSLEQPALPSSDAHWIRKPSIRTADGIFTSPSIKYYLGNLKPAHNYWFKLAVHFKDDEPPFNVPLESTMLRSRTPPLYSSTEDLVDEVDGTGVSVQSTTRPPSTMAPQPSSPAAPSSPSVPSSSTPDVVAPSTTTASSGSSSSTESHRAEPAPSSELPFSVPEAPATPIATVLAEIVTQPKQQQQQQPTTSSTTTTTTTSTTTTTPPSTTETHKQSTMAASSTTPVTTSPSTVATSSATAQPQPSSSPSARQDRQKKPEEQPTTIESTSTFSISNGGGLEGINSVNGVNEINKPDVHSLPPCSTKTIDHNSINSQPTDAEDNRLPLPLIDKIQMEMNAPLQRYAWHLLLALSVMTVLFTIVTYLYLKKSVRVIAPITSHQSAYDNPTFTKIVSHLHVDENSQNYNNNVIQKNRQADLASHHLVHQMNDLHHLNGRQHLI